MKTINLHDVLYELLPLKVNLEVSKRVCSHMKQFSDYFSQLREKYRQYSPLNQELWEGENVLYQLASRYDNNINCYRYVPKLMTHLQDENCQHMMRLDVGLDYFCEWVRSVSGPWPTSTSRELFEEAVSQYYRDNGCQVRCHFPMYRVRKRYHSHDFLQFFDGRDGFAYLIFESRDDMMMAKLKLSNRPLPEL